MPALKLAHVAVKMLDAELVISSDVTAFQHRPERLDPIGVCHPVNVPPCTVAHSRMWIGQIVIGSVLIGVHFRPGRHALGNEPL